MDPATREFLIQRAKNRCEYCHFPAQLLGTGPTIDHIRARQHHGDDSTGNLAVACPRCNAYKGPNLAGVDPETNRSVMLFNPRRHPWNKHFARDGAFIVGLTPAGRATIDVLRMNEPEAVAQR